MQASEKLTVTSVGFVRFSFCPCQISMQHSHAQKKKKEEKKNCLEGNVYNSPEHALKESDYNTRTADWVVLFNTRTAHLNRFCCAMGRKWKHKHFKLQTGLCFRKHKRFCIILHLLSSFCVGSTPIFHEACCWTIFNSLANWAATLHLEGCIRSKRFVSSMC